MPETTFDVSEQSLQRLTTALQEMQRRQQELAAALEQSRFAIAHQQGGIDLMQALLAAKAQAEQA